MPAERQRIERAELRLLLTAHTFRGHAAALAELHLIGDRFVDATHARAGVQDKPAGVFAVHFGFDQEVTGDGLSDFQFRWGLRVKRRTLRLDQHGLFVLCERNAREAEHSAKPGEVICPHQDPPYRIETTRDR